MKILRLMSMLVLILLLSTLDTSAQTSVTINMTPIGNPSAAGNACTISLNYQVQANTSSLQSITFAINNNQVGQVSVSGTQHQSIATGRVLQAGVLSGVHTVNMTITLNNGMSASQSAPVFCPSVRSNVPPATILSLSLLRLNGSPGSEISSEAWQNNGTYTIDLNTTPGPISVQAIITLESGVEEIQFDVYRADGTLFHSHREFIRPFTINFNEGTGAICAWNLPASAGQVYTIIATPYNTAGVAGRPFTVNVQIFNNVPQEFTCE